MVIKRANNESLIAADDNPMDVTGVTRFCINGIMIRAIVSASVKDDILVGWHDLMRLGIIPEEFPNPQFNNNQCSQISDEEESKTLEMRTKQFMDNYNDVIQFVVTHCVTNAADAACRRWGEVSRPAQTSCQADCLATEELMSG